jgi:CheY-like chemotaxis protein
MSNLLIVDDEKNIRSSLETFFLSCGHRVATASDARAALGALEGADGFDLVLTDFRMAEMNGLELLKQIKRRFPDASVVLMTAYATVENAVAAMKAGASDYLSKPFSLQEVQHVVERALELRSLRVENRVLRAALDELAMLESRSPLMRALVDTARRRSATRPFCCWARAALARTCWRGRFTDGARDRRGRSWWLTAPRCPSNCWKASCSATCAGRLPARSRTNPGGWRRPTAARYFSTRSPI